MPSPPVSRDQLSKFLPDQQTIKAFERILQNGSLAQQDADSVTISGGTMDGVVIGGSDAAAASFTTIEASGQITSAVADGTAPMVVESSTQVDNLRAEFATEADHAALADLALEANHAATADLADVATLALLADFATALATARTIGGVSFDGTADITVASATGNFTVTLGFGCNGAAPQTAAVAGAAVAATGATNAAPYGYTTAAQANDIVTRLNAIRAALVANGIMS